MFSLIFEGNDSQSWCAHSDVSFLGCTKSPTQIMDDEIVEFGGMLRNHYGNKQFTSHRIHGPGICTYMKTIKINHSCRWIYRSSHGSYGLGVNFKNMPMFCPFFGMSQLGSRVFEGSWVVGRGKHGYIYHTWILSEWKYVLKILYLYISLTEPKSSDRLPAGIETGHYKATPSYFTLAN